MNCCDCDGDDGDDHGWRLIIVAFSFAPLVRATHGVHWQSYLDSLKKRFANTEEVKKVSKHQHLPKALHNAKKRKVESVDKARRKDMNRRKYTKPEDRHDVKEKAAAVVQVVD